MIEYWYFDYVGDPHPLKGIVRIDRERDEAKWEIQVKTTRSRNFTSCAVADRRITKAVLRQLVGPIEAYRLFDDDQDYINFRQAPFLALSE